MRHPAASKFSKDYLAKKKKKKRGNHRQVFLFLFVFCFLSLKWKQLFLQKCKAGRTRFRKGMMHILFIHVYIQSFHKQNSFQKPMVKAEFKFPKGTYIPEKGSDMHIANKLLYALKEVITR